MRGVLKVREYKMVAGHGRGSRTYGHKHGDDDKDKDEKW